jgi:hypothetical protein
MNVTLWKALVAFVPVGMLFSGSDAFALKRARELFHMAGDNIEEEQALDDTMYALHTLCETHRKLALLTASQ